MIYKKIYLKDIDNRFADERLTLSIFISEDNEAVTLRPGLIVVPGGGYSFCSPREAEPIATRFLSEGFNCFILNYSVNKQYPAPHLDLALVFAYIKEHEEEFRLIKNCLSLTGYSAGGHLVGSYGYLYPELAKMLGKDEKMLRPYAIIMGYPVITTSKLAHPGTRDIITGGSKALIEKLDIAKNVTKDYPPTFVWTTKDDDLVPYENTLMMKEALENNKVDHQVIIFDSGYHGASVANRSCYDKHVMTERMKDIRDWASLAADFIFNKIDN